MDGRSFMFGLWTLLVVAGFIGATSQAYSPFADGGRVSPRAGMVGPTHK